MTAPKTVREPRIRVSDLNIRKTAQRVLAGQSLVSPEIEFVQRELGISATQTQLDASVVAVRRLPWSSIVVPE